MYQDLYGQGGGQSNLHPQTYRPFPQVTSTFVAPATPVLGAFPYGPPIIPLPGPWLGPAVGLTPAQGGFIPLPGLHFGQASPPLQVTQAQIQAQAQALVLAQAQAQAQQAQIAAQMQGYTPAGPVLTAHATAPLRSSSHQQDSQYSRWSTTQSQDQPRRGVHDGGAGWGGGGDRPHRHFTEAPTSFSRDRWQEREREQEHVQPHNQQSDSRGTASSGRRSTDPSRQLESSPHVGGGSGGDMRQEDESMPPPEYGGGHDPPRRERIVFIPRQPQPAIGRGGEEHDGGNEAQQSRRSDRSRGRDGDEAGSAVTSGAANGSRFGPPVGVGGGGGGSHLYRVLGRNIRRLVAALTPSQEEGARKEEALALVRRAVADAFPEYQGHLQVEPFGSYVSGLGTRSSDIDVVVVGLEEPSQDLGFYSKNERPRVARLLDRLSPHLRARLRPTKLITIRHARVPILKLTTRSNVCVDISIAGHSGPQAAAFIRQQVSAHPALRPLVLVLKSYMRAVGLSEVASGGLSSYGLTYMTLAHLMEESRRGSDLSDLGRLLHSLLRRYGRCFNTASMAVSVGDGGLRPRSGLLGWNADHMDRIVTIDPLTGRNCTEGTFRSSEVLSALARADAYLNHWAARPEATVGEEADILGPLLGQHAPQQAEEDEDEEDEQAEVYAAPAGGPLGKRGRSQELRVGGGG